MSIQAGRIFRDRVAFHTEGGFWTRYVTLSGPDWGEGTTYMPGGHTWAVLLDGVVGVYTTTVVLDRESTWTK